jgi:hypothetical protein
MKEVYSKQNKRNALRERANRVIHLIKGGVWILHKVIFKLFEGVFIKEVVKIKILSTLIIP